MLDTEPNVYLKQHFLGQSTYGSNLGRGHWVLGKSWRVVLVLWRRRRSARSRAIVAEHSDQVRRLGSAEALFDRLEHYVADV